MDLRLGAEIRPIDLAVFDCDGVLLESMAAKIEAFERWVPPAHEAQREPFMRLVMDGFGRSRSHHIRSFYEDLLGQPIGVEDLEAEVARFTEICEPLCARAPWRSGSREFVAACREADIPRYVLSGTPQAPLEAMLASTGAAGYFERIVGSPPAKPESLGKLVSGAGVGPDRTVFVGDAEVDRAAAEAVGTHFVYFPSEANPPKGPIATRVTDLRELLV